MNRLKSIGYVVAVILVVYFVGYQITWKWGICRKYCNVGESLRITRKTGEPASPSRYAKENEKGVLEQMRGPGRHFLNPWTFTIKNVRDINIKPGQIGVMTSKVGKNLPPDRFIASPDEKGVQKRVLTPGLWRINDHGIKVDVFPSTIIPPGYVGVRTMLEGQSKGVLDDVLPPGYYNVNPKEVKIDIVEVGYREKTIQTKIDPGTGMPIEGTGIFFPTADGFLMYIDVTVVWGLLPKNAPLIIRDYGNIDLVDIKIIHPQIDSICRINGSRYTAQQFIEGLDREKFQVTLTSELKKVGDEKGIEFLLALVRRIYPPEEIRQPIQLAKIAEEEKQTLDVQKLTDEVAGKLEEAKKNVEITVKDFNAETSKLVESERAKGLKKAAETEAETTRLVATIDAQTASVEAKTIRLLGQANADVVEAMRKADADKFKQFVAAYGGGRIYNLALFAEKLPDALNIEYKYSGEGTFWTDLHGKSGDLLERALLKSLQANQKNEKKK